MAAIIFTLARKDGDTARRVAKRVPSLRQGRSPSENVGGAPQSRDVFNRLKLPGALRGVPAEGVTKNGEAGRSPGEGFPQLLKAIDSRLADSTKSREHGYLVSAGVLMGRSANRWSEGLKISVFLVSFAIFFAREGLHPEQDQLVIGLFWLFSTNLLAERGAQLILAWQRDRDNTERDKLIHSVAVMPGLLLREKEVTTFPSALAAINHVSEALVDAQYVLNTVLRYGDTESERDIYGLNYQRWMQSKEESIKRKCIWIELVSEHFSTADPQRLLVSKYKGNKYRYSGAYIDDRALKIIQATIIHRGPQEKEMVFGWEHPDVAGAEAWFLTKDKTLISYFEGYYRGWLNSGTKF